MTTAEALKEMMEAWNKIMEAARQQFPNATEDELYQVEGTDASDALIDRYHFLRDFAKTHAEAGAIFAAID